MILVDSGAWFARFVADDPNHANVVQWFAANSERLITTDYCVDEALTLLVARKRPVLASEVGREFFNETVSRLHFLTNAQVPRAWIMFTQRAAAGWSFTDCTSKVVIDELQLNAAVALDEHFRQFGIAVFP
jgi:predicted nucleic acid-binding protein